MARLFLLIVVAAAAPTALAREADPFARLSSLPAYEMDEVLWLARCVLSESNRADEQRLVAWVVRNRVETGYRGTTYREVVLEPFQFSAFNKNTDRRKYLLGLDERDTRDKAWKSVLAIALDVYHAPAAERPFDIETRHFYSPVSMPGRSTPRWAEGRPAVALAEAIDPDRFQFFAHVDYAADAPRGSRLAIDPIDVEPETTRRRRLTSLAERIEERRARLKTTIRRPQRPASPAARPRSR